MHGTSKGKVYAGCDASGGALSADPRLRIVSWAVVVAAWRPAEELMCDEPSLTILGTIAGSLQVGANVADGETEAISQLLQHCHGEVEFCSDSSAALTRYRKKQLAVPDGDNVKGFWTKSQSQLPVITGAIALVIFGTIRIKPSERPTGRVIIPVITQRVHAPSN